MPPDNFSKDAKPHIKEAWQNYCLYDMLLTREPDWALVLLFYSALHLVQAHAVNAKSKDRAVRLPENHRDREDYVSQKLGRIFIDYRELQTGSEDARYNIVKKAEATVLEYHNSEFLQIINHLATKGVSWESRMTKEERDAVRSKYFPPDTNEQTN